jgi:hypothetical protein
VTRPAVRMCTRCERRTDEPVLIHKIHALTGPGFNVYACPQCAPHYPPRTGTPEPGERPHRHRSRLTLRIYKIDTTGRVTDDRGEVEILAGGPNEPVPQTSADPPCTCPRCRAPR